MGMYTSNVTYTCIPCRFSAKATSTCPYCHAAMTYMGKAFKPPRKSNDSQWRKVALMVQHDLRFGYCSCHRGERKIRSLAEAKNLVGFRRSAKKTYAKSSDPRTEQINRRKSWKAREYS
jgi:hypothetical protein